MQSGIPKPLCVSGNAAQAHGPLGEVEYEGGREVPESRGGRAREEEEAHDTDTGLFHIDEHGNKVPRRCRVGAASPTIATCKIPRRTYHAIYSRRDDTCDRGCN